MNMPRRQRHYMSAYMVLTMHKLLIHVSTIIENILLPIGQLAEATNKHFRLCREKYARQFPSYECMNSDIHNTL